MLTYEEVCRELRQSEKLAWSITQQLIYSREVNSKMLDLLEQATRQLIEARAEIERLKGSAP